MMLISCRIRRLRAEGHQVVDRPRPRSSVNVESLAVNHGGVAVVAAPGVRLTTANTDIHPTSFEHVSASDCCEQIVLHRRRHLPAGFGSHSVCVF